MIKHPAGILLAFLGGDMALLVFLACYIGWMLPVGVIIATAFLGSLVICFVVVHYRRLIRESLDKNMLNDNVLDKFLIVAAGGLLIYPGIFSDTLGVILLLPFIRRLVSTLLTRL